MTSWGILVRENFSRMFEEQRLLKKAMEWKKEKIQEIWSCTGKGWLTYRRGNFRYAPERKPYDSKRQRIKIFFIRLIPASSAGWKTEFLRMFYKRLEIGYFGTGSCLTFPGYSLNYYRYFKTMRWRVWKAWHTLHIWCIRCCSTRAKSIRSGWSKLFTCSADLSSWNWHDWRYKIGGYYRQ